MPFGTRLQLRFPPARRSPPGGSRTGTGETLRVAGVPILLFPDSLGLRPDTTGAFEPTYQTETDTAGVYQFSGLSLDRGYTVHAFYDRNGDSYLDRELEVVAGHGMVVRLTPERSVADSINIVAVDPKAPAILNGSIASPDSSARFLVEARASARFDSDRSRRTDRAGDLRRAFRRVATGSARRMATTARMLARAPATSAIPERPSRWRRRSR